MLAFGWLSWNFRYLCCITQVHYMILIFFTMTNKFVGMCVAKTQAFVLWWLSDFKISHWSIFFSTLPCVIWMTKFKYGIFATFKVVRLNLVGPMNNLHNTKFIPTRHWIGLAVHLIFMQKIIWNLKHISKEIEMHFEATMGT